jgi:hypothetical protein
MMRFKRPSWFRKLLNIVLSAVLPSGLVLLAGKFRQAGAVPAENLAIWDPSSSTLQCLGREAGNGECYSANFCCQGMSGEVWSVLSVSKNRVVVAGAFFDTSSATGVISSNLMVLSMDDDLQSWERVPVVDPASGDYTGTDGPIKALRCMQQDQDSGNCTQVLLGGWFDSLETYQWQDTAPSRFGRPSERGFRWRDAPRTLQGTAHPLKGPLAVLHVTNSAKAELESLALHEAHSSPLVGGINALETGNGEVIMGGLLPGLGNLARLDTNNSTLERAVPEDAASIAWQCVDLAESYTVDTVNDSLSFCCHTGSMCPYLGLSVSCPKTGGYHCSPDQTKPACCPEGNYCPNPADIFICPIGSYCPGGSIAAMTCGWFNWCHYEGLARPDKVMAGVFAGMLTGAAFIILLLLHLAYQRVR